MVDGHVLGMPIEVDESVTAPVGAVVIVKALDAAGDMIHWIGKTSDVTQVEAVGMLIAAGDEYRARLLDLPRTS